MKKISILFALIFTIAGKSQGQVTVNMTDENVNPDYFEFHIPFLELDFARANSTFFADFGGRLKVKGFYADLNYRISYVNGLEETYYTVNEPTANSIYDYKAPKEFKAMFGYMVMQRETPTTITFHLKSQGQTNYVTKVASKKTSFVMVDLGIRKGFNWVYCGDKDLKFEGVDVPEGFVAPEPEAVRTMMDYTMLQVGISAGSLGFYKANISTYGDRRAEKSVRYYLDALFLLGSKVDDIYSENTLNGFNATTTLYTRYKLDGSPRSRVGACLGAEMTNISRFGFNGGLEAAYIPGIKGSFGSNFCLTIRSSISIAKILN